MWQHKSRQLRSWARSPQFYAIKLKDRLFGIGDPDISASHHEYTPGSVEWLILAERKYGGIQLGGASTKTNRGGDRMALQHHGYSRCYSEFLAHWVERREHRLTIVEVGILNGNGLAIWCDLFPHARIMGFDIDLSNFEANRAKLEQLGAFTQNRPEVFELDQLDRDGAAQRVGEVLAGDNIDIAIDDGCHTIESIEITFEALRPHLAEEFCYFIEDNYDTYDRLAPHYPQYRWRTRGEIAVVTPK